MWITMNCGKYFKRWKYQTTLPAFWEICMQVNQQQLEMDMEHRTGSKLGDVKAVYCHPPYVTYVQSTSHKTLGWMKHQESSTAGIKIARRNTNNLRYADNTTLMAVSKEDLKSVLMKLKEQVKKLAYNSALKKLISWHTVPSLHGKWTGKQWKQWQTLFSWAPKSLQIVTAAIKLKDTCSLEEKLWPT